MNLYRRSTGEYMVVRATINANITEAFMARRIVNSFGLSASARSPPSPTSDFVDLTCDAGPDKPYESYRFYILESCSFDVCIGQTPSKLPKT